MKSTRSTRPAVRTSSTVRVVARPLGSPALEAALAGLRRRGGQRVLAPRGALWPLVCSLRREGVVGLLVDEDAPRRAVFAPFLGTLAATRPTPAFLQRVTGAPIAVVSCARVGRGRFRLRCWEVIRPAPCGDAAAELQRGGSRDVRGSFPNAMTAGHRTETPSWGAWGLTAAGVVAVGLLLWAARWSIAPALDRWLPAAEEAPAEPEPAPEVVDLEPPEPAAPVWTFDDLAVALEPLPGLTETLIAEGRAELPHLVI